MTAHSISEGCAEAGEETTSGKISSLIEGTGSIEVILTSYIPFRELLFIVFRHGVSA
jgi:hypothetical protein